MYDDYIRVIDCISVYPGGIFFVVGHKIATLLTNNC